MIRNTDADVESGSHDSCGPDHHAPSAGGLLTVLGLAVVAGLYVWAACDIAAVSLHQINPDGVAYMRLARYWAEGRLDLAVSSYWGPLLSWLLVPSAWLGLDPYVTFKVYQVVFGLGLAGATALLARRLGYGQTILMPATIALLLALPMLFEPVTPDLLLTMLVTLCFACGAGLLDKPSARGAAATGALAALCYLAKAYALPFFAVMLVVTAVVRRVTGRGLGGRYLLSAAAAFIVVAGPWIAVISVREAKFTFSTVNDSASAWSPGGGAEKPLPLFRLQRPRPGRVTSWENPPEIPYAWPVWSPLDGLDGLKRQATVAAAGWGAVLEALVEADRFALLLAGFILAVALMVRQRGTRRPGAAARVWVCVLIFVYLTGYTLVLVHGRYLWPVYGAMAAMALWAIDDCTAGRSGPPRSGGRLGRRGRAAGQVLVVILSIALPISLAWRVQVIRDEWHGPAGGRAKMHWVRAVGRALPADRPVASDDWYRGLFAAYWRDTACLGELAGKTPQAVAAELAPYGRACVVIWYDWDLAAGLADHPSFRLLSEHPHPGEPHVATVLTFDPPAKAPEAKP